MASLARDQARKLRTWSLLTAEFLTGTLLILGGWAMLVRRPRGFALHLVSLGMLLYVSIFSIGVFNGSPASAFFIAVALATAAVVVAEIARANPELTSRPRVTE